MSYAENKQKKKKKRKERKCKKKRTKTKTGEMQEMVKVALYTMKNERIL